MQKLAKALVDFRKKVPTVAYDSTNPHFKSRFASLAAIHKAVDPVLAECGLTVSQFPVSDENGVGVRTAIIHESGEWFEGQYVLPLQKRDPQGAGSALTYARRYALAATLGIVADDDDDANAAVEQVVKDAGKRAAAKRPTGPASNMGKDKKEKVLKAAQQRMRELADEGTGSFTPREIIDAVAQDMGMKDALALTDKDFEDAFTRVQGWAP